MSKFLNTKEKRKSALITTIIMSVLIFAMFYVGLSYLDPPEEFGIALNFGTSTVGKGNFQPKQTSTPVVKKQIQEVKTSSEKSVTNKVVKASEKVITQNTEDAIAIKKQQDEKKKALEIEKKEREKQKAIAKQKAEEDAKKKKLDALIGGINNAKGTSSSGEGDDNQAGDKGKTNGNPNVNGYYGNGGLGGNGDYYLGNRKPTNKPKPKYLCNEEGLVVVEIKVDNQGNVIKATAGVKGSTNTANCLVEQARDAALKTKWQPDAKAPSQQTGRIKYRFKLAQ
ncbi:energy transducer TonB [Lutibacter sp.]|uniref:energy transducer TonB family protein n=1 Tax=Lutibacter sp. TaxID=1925666 RepID=UPI0025BAF3E8|nr:energy transducer TonB [Lutibacter sp.]MCF6182840.1 energy transducer TonB [Lutibacter sp.]